MTAQRPEPRIRVRRHPERGSYDPATLHAVLDAGWMGHVGIVQDGQPVVIPMLYARIGEAVYLHGAVASRLLKHLATGLPVCLSVAHLDGLVLARSQFSHSVNYRSAVVFGQAEVVDDPAEKARVLVAFVDALLPGRADESRPADASELAATHVLRLHIEAASVKQRSGGVKDHAADLGLPVWAGVVPMQLRYAAPLTETDTGSPQIPPSVRRLLASGV